MEQGPLNHSIYHDPGTEHVHWGKPVPHGWHTEHFSCDAPLGIDGKWTAHLLRGFYPIHPAGCSLGNNFLCVRTRRAICESSTGASGPVLTNMLSHSLCSIKTGDTASNLVPLTIHFSKGSSGSWWYWSTLWFLWFLGFALPWCRLPSWRPQILEVLSELPAQFSPWAAAARPVAEAQPH